MEVRYGLNEILEEKVPYSNLLYHWRIEHSSNGNHGLGLSLIDTPGPRAMPSSKVGIADEQFRKTIVYHPFYGKDRDS
jgi:hypothetical protein